MSETTIKTLNEIVRERLNEASELARKLFRDAVKPIYGTTDKGDPFHIGSALLLQIPEGRLMLTAAHVIDWTRQTTLYIGADDFAPLQFEATVTAAPEGKRDKDHLDFAIGRLGADVLVKLSGAKFITEAEISHSVAPTSDRAYTCLGYPNSKNKIKPHKGTVVTPSLLPYTSLGRPVSQLPEIAKDDLHILVDYDAKHARDESGAKFNATAMRGCSGGAIIDAGRISLETLGGRLEPKVAALLIEGYAREKVILGTRLIAILAAIRKHLQVAADAPAAPS